MTSKIEVLGSGDAFHADARAHTSYLVEPIGGSPLLVDVGATTPLRLREGGHDPARIGAVLLTHFHGDHLLGLPVLLLQLRFVSGRISPLTIAGPAGVEAACRSILETAYPGVETGFEIHFVELDGAEVDLCGLRVEARPVTHRPESLGYRLTLPSGRIVAIGGDSAFDERLVELVRGADVAFIEASLVSQPEEPIAHVSCDELAERRGELAATKIYFTHLGEEVSEKLRSSSIGIPAWDGMKIEL